MKKLKPLFYEFDSSTNTEKISLGRISFWSAFLVTFFYWVFNLINIIVSTYTTFEYQAMDVPNSLLEFLLITLGYNLSKKAVSVFEKRKLTIDGVEVSRRELYSDGDDQKGER